MLLFQAGSRVACTGDASAALEVRQGVWPGTGTSSWRVGRSVPSRGRPFGGSARTRARSWGRASCHLVHRPRKTDELLGKLRWAEKHRNAHTQVQTTTPRRAAGE